MNGQCDGRYIASNSITREMITISFHSFLSSLFQCSIVCRVVLHLIAIPVPLQCSRKLLPTPHYSSTSLLPSTLFSIQIPFRFPSPPSFLPSLPPIPISWSHASSFRIPIPGPAHGSPAALRGSAFRLMALSILHTSCSRVTFNSTPCLARPLTLHSAPSLWLSPTPIPTLHAHSSDSATASLLTCSIGVPHLSVLIMLLYAYCVYDLPNHCILPYIIPTLLAL